MRNKLKLKYPRKTFNAKYVTYFFLEIVSIIYLNELAEANYANVTLHL